MADKIVVMSDGIVEQTGDPLDALRPPVNTFVAGFIGSPAMNMIPGVVARRRRGARMSSSAAASRCRAGARAPTTASEVLFGMRPEHCALADSSGLPVEVVVVEPTGADTQLYCRFDGQDLTAVVRDRVTCRAGDRDRPHARPRRGRIFSTRASGSRSPHDVFRSAHRSRLEPITPRRSA